MYLASHPSYHLNCWKSIGSMLCLAILNSNIFNEHIQFVFLKSKAFCRTIGWHTSKQSNYIYIKYLTTKCWLVRFWWLITVFIRFNCSNRELIFFQFIELPTEKKEKYVRWKVQTCYYIYLRSQTRPHTLDFSGLICSPIVCSCMK